MNQERQCANCKHKFSSSFRFCPKCRSYWKQRNHSSNWSSQTLEVNNCNAYQSNDAISDDSPLPSDVTSKPAFYIICNECNNKVFVASEFPDFCPNCNSLLDTLSEKFSTEASDSKNNSICNYTNTYTAVPAKTSPFSKYPPKRDHSSLSFICQNEGKITRLCIGDEIQSITIGKKGDWHPEFFIDSSFQKIHDKHVSVYHKDSGWYLMALDKDTYVSGSSVNIAESRLLSPEDTILLGDCQLKPEFDRLEQ